MREKFSAETRSDQDGYIEIKDGHVTVHEASGQGIPVILHPDPGAAVRVNGKEIDSPSTLKASDVVEIEPLEETVSGSVEARIAQDGMKAEVKVSPGLQITRKVDDLSAQGEVYLKLEENRQKYPDISVQDVNNALAEQGVVFGLDAPAIEQAVKEAADEWVVVAHGKEAVPGKDGYVELHVDVELKSITHDQEALSRVDYKEKIEIPSVSEGDLLATIHPPEPGKPGKRVTGEALEPPPVEPVQVQCKEGCTLSPEGDKVLAQKAGRPVVEGKKNEKFTIAPLFVHNGDVDMDSGNIRFSGDVKIAGDVHEGMLIEGAGSVEVMGSTAGARVLGGQNVVFHKNLINTKVEAGALKGLYKSLLPLLSEVEETLSTLYYGVEQLKEVMTSRGKSVEEKETGRLAKLIADKKFEQLPQTVEEVSSLVNQTNFVLPRILTDAISRYENLFKEMGFLDIQSNEELMQLVEEAKETRDFVERTMDELVGDVMASYVQNCTVVSSGNITINGPGTYNSYFYAGGDVHIERISRGGGITAEGNLFIGEAGSPGMAIKPRKIQLSSSSVAKFRKVYENVIVVFGKRIHKFEEMQTNVKVYYSAEDDRIIIINL